MKYINVFFMLLLLSQNLHAREIIRLNEGWFFKQNDPKQIEGDLEYTDIKNWILPTGNPFVSEDQRHFYPESELEGCEYTLPEYNDSSWRKLNIPHDWGIESKFNQDYPGETGKLSWWGIAWYRKHLDIDITDKGKRIFLDIDGAMSFATIWCNGKFVGGWPYGYSSFRVDLTPYLTPGGQNVIAIRLDNIKGSARWYPGGGLYRNVWLVKTNPIHIGQWGTKIIATNVNDNSAKLDIDIDVDNTSLSEAEVKIKTEIFNCDNGKPVGKPLVSENRDIQLAPYKNHLKKHLILKNPQKWDIKSPHLYIAVVSIISGSKTIDTYNTVFGIRSIEFKVDDGFHLNGRRVQLKGVCMHHDLGCLGAAVNVRALERQLEMLKEMGVNAIRTSHNPPAPELLDLCDKMGFVVIDELVDVWLEAKQPKGYNILFEDWHEQDLRAMIRRDKNHPSVIMWSTGNEVREQASYKGIEISKKLANIVKEEDSTRPVTGGCSNPDAGFHDFARTLDVFGFNYKPHLYPKFEEQNLDIPYYASETSSCISTRGEYFFPVTDERTDGRSGFHLSSYDLYGTTKGAYPPDVEFKAQDQNPAVAGQFVWTGFDYLGEPSPFNSDQTVLLNFHDPVERSKAEKELKELGKIKVPSRSSYFGIIDLAGFKKDRFYLYQSRWRPDFPMVHILPHWTWPKRIGEITPIHVYTSGDSAELFINGKSVGLKKKNQYEYRLRWDSIVYTPGEVKVVAYRNGKKWAENSMKTAGSATNLSLAADRTEMKADGEDLIFVTVKIMDKDDILVPRAHNLVSFTISGPAEIVATDNGDPTSHESFKNNYVKAFNGLALVVLKSKKGKKGSILLKAESDNLKAKSITLYSR